MGIPTTGTPQVRTPVYSQNRCWLSGVRPRQAPVFVMPNAGFPSFAPWLARWYPPNSVFLAVVDPGVGSERDAVVLQADGPAVHRTRQRSALGRGGTRGAYPNLAGYMASRHAPASFRGGDLFASMAAWVSRGELPPDKLDDHYGNAPTGLRAEAVPRSARLAIADTDVG